MSTCCTSSSYTTFACQEKRGLVASDEITLTIDLELTKSLEVAASVQAETSV